MSGVRIFRFVVFSFFLGGGRVFGGVGGIRCVVSFLGCGRIIR